MAEWDLDLLGDPIPDGLGRRGRPPHLATLENRRKVVVLAAFDRTEEQIAAALGISVPTLKKHYFRELRSKAEARHRLEGKLLLTLVNEAEKGNAGAADKLFKRLDRHDLLTGRIASAKPQRQEKKGKKVLATETAHTAHEETAWSGLVRH